MVCAGVCGCGCVQMCVGGASVSRCAWVCFGICRGGPGCVWKCSGVWVCMGMGGRVWDEFSEYLLETRVLTSADFNTYPIRIFISKYNKRYFLLIGI